MIRYDRRKVIGPSYQEVQVRKLILGGIAVLLAWSGEAAADEASALRAVNAQVKVMHSALDGSGSLYAAVKPERGVWKHYAEQLCMLVRPHQARIFQVRIVDITSVSAAQPPAAWKRLAEAKCG